MTETCDKKTDKVDFSAVECIIDVDDLNSWFDLVTKQAKDAQQKIIYGSSEFVSSKWIYRGQSAANWDIESSFRRQIQFDESKVSNLERNLRGKEAAAIESFRAKTWSFVSKPKMSKLEWLMLMRHHGVPTRLVDFTESAAIALYFATETEPKDDFAVWAIKREGMINAFMCSQFGTKLPGWEEISKEYGDRAMDEVNNKNTSDPLIKCAQEYLDNFIQSEATVAMLGEYNRDIASKLVDTPLTESVNISSKIGTVWFYPKEPSARMRAQRGLFIMPLMLSTSFMTAIYRSFEGDRKKKRDNIPRFPISDPNRILPRLHNLKIAKFVFKREQLSAVRDLLIFANCSMETLYPDMDGAAKAVASQVKASLSGYVDFEDDPTVMQLI